MQMKNKSIAFIQLLLFLFPWKIRRVLLNKLFSFKIDNTAHISFSIILAKKLVMYQYSEIGNFNFCNAIDILILEKNSIIANFNYITGYPSSLINHFSHVENRKCQLIIGEHSAITSRHFIDCTAGITIGNFTTMAGIRSQILTHSIDLEKNRQNASPVIIGSYCFIGTDCVLLMGSKLPDYCVLGAKSLLNKNFIETYCLYGGVPARKIKELTGSDIKYFQRKTGFVS
jgi:acetyltransferase-like isoleucine patch superfamily enzyme